MSPRLVSANLANGLFSRQFSEMKCSPKEAIWESGASLTCFVLTDFDCLYPTKYF